MADEILDVRTANRTIEWFKDYLGRKWVDQEFKRRAKLKRKLGHWLPPQLHPNRLVDLFACYLHDVEVHGDQTFDRSPRSRSLLSHATSVRHVQARLSPRSIGQLRALLKNKATVEGYLYQSRIAAHFIRGGAEMISFSLGGEVEGDVLIRTRDNEIELQCKCLEHGAGRKIHPSDFAKIGAKIVSACAASGAHVLIEVRCKRRYEPRDRSKLVKGILGLLSGGADAQTEVDGYSIMVRTRNAPMPWKELEIASRPDSGKPLARPHVAFLGFRALDGRDELHALLSMRSEREDQVVDAILRRVKQAAMQLSTGGPSVLFVHIPESIPWNLIRSSGYFERRIAQLSRHPAQKRVSGLVFTSESKLMDGHYDGFSLINRGATTALPPGFEILRGVVAGPIVS